MKSKYQIFWVILSPMNGVVTLHDQKAFGAVLTHRGTKRFERHFPNRESALAWLDSFDKKLDKQYTATLCTDAQFALQQYPNYEIPFTSKQKAESKVIG